MKNHTLILTVAAAGLLIGGSGYSQSMPTPTASPFGSNDQCRQSGWNTAIYIFCGDKDAMIKNIASLPVQLSERRVFLQITQGDSKGEVKLYERQEDGKFTVTKWSNEKTFKLLPEIDKAIFENRGVNCVGEQVIAVLRKLLGSGEAVQSIAAPESPAAAFKHSVQDAQGKFIQTEIFLLC